MENKKICFRCNQEIREEENYFSFTEFNNKEIIKTEYAHKKCWINFLNQISDTTEAMGMLRGIKKTLITQGLLPSKEYDLKC